MCVCVCVDVARYRQNYISQRFYMKLSSRVIIITNQSFLIIKKVCILIDKSINLFLCHTSIKESANSRKVSMLWYDLSMLFVRFTLKCISNVHSNHQLSWNLLELCWNCFSLQPWQWIAALYYSNKMAMTPCLIPDDKLPIILAVVIPIVVVAVFAGVFAGWLWRRNKDKKIANKGNYIKLYN